MKPKQYDFSGWATVNNIRCSDGRTILRDAFAHQNGMEVPLVWGHVHDDPENTIGKAYLENRPEGVYTYASFNSGKKAAAAKIALEHGDINSLSIFANHLKQDDKRNVMHGDIKEVSLVLSGANPGAVIDFVLAHSDDNEEDETSAIIYNPIETIEVVSHSDDETQPTEETLEHSENDKEEKSVAEEKKEGGEITLGDAFDAVLNKLTKEEQDVVLAVIGLAADSGSAAQSDEGGENLAHEDEENNNPEENNNSNEEDETTMKHNAFDEQNGVKKNDAATLSHDDLTKVFAEAKRRGSLKDAVNHADEYLAHSIEWDPQEYSENPLYPDPKAVGAPATIDRNQEWVSKFMNACRKVPFSRVKMLAFDITEDEARAKGYVTGAKKVEEVIKVLKRHTDPQTIYKLQKMDRDDLLDITDFNVVAYLKGEMRVKLDEEQAVAALLGDGRSDLSPDKIKEDCVRPIWTDDDIFTIKASIERTESDTNTTMLKKFREAAIKARKNYKGSGNPILFTTEDMLADLLLMDDGIGHPLYKDESEVARAFRVSSIVTVPQMEGRERTEESTKFTLLGIIVNPADYTWGNNRGGEPTMFDDFDIDYNKYTYLIETRKSGALTTPYSAITIELEETIE